MSDSDSAQEAQWRAKVEKDLAGQDADRRLAYQSFDGLKHTALSHPGNAAIGAVGVPGESPFIRGTRLPHVGGLWQVGCEVEGPHPAEANKRLLEDLGLDVQLVWLSWPAASEASGPKLNNQNDVDAVLRGVEPQAVEWVLDVGARGAASLASWISWQRRLREPVALSDLRANLAFDPLALWAADGTLPGSLDSAYDQLAAMVRWTIAAPQWRSMQVSARAYHEAGASAVQELAMALAALIEHLRQLAARGIAPQKAAKHLWALWSCGRGFFEDMAKLRAWRWLVTKVLTALDCGELAGAQRMVARSSRTTWTAADASVNLLRSSSQCFAAAVAGADSIVLDRFDQLHTSNGTSGDDQALSRRLAVTLQHVLAREAHMARVADPAGGSWAIDSMTDKLARAAWQLMQEIESRGGMATCLADGWVHEQIEKTVEERRRRLRTRRDVVVGVSMFQNLDEVVPPDLDLGSEPSGDGLSEESWRSEPASGAPEPALLDLDELVVALDTSDLRSVAQSTWRGSAAVCPPLQRFREASEFEQLRRRFQELRAAPILLLCLGAPADFRARAEFAAGIFQIAGIRADLSEPLADLDAVVAAVKASDAPLVVLCSSDEIYRQRAGAIAETLGSTRDIWLAGRPDALGANGELPGVNFIYAGCDVIAVLEQALGNFVTGTTRQVR